MTKIPAHYSDRALAALNAGFVSKAAKQDAIGNLNRAFDMLTATIRDGLLNAAPTREERDQPEWSALYYGLPALHNWKPKHSEMFASFVEEVAEIQGLVEQRDVIKAAPVNAPIRKEPSPYEVKARETLMDLIERRQTQYLRAIDLAAIFNGLPVSANTHYCVADTGTPYLRTFYFLAGEFTPLSVILAAADELKRREA